MNEPTTSKTDQRGKWANKREFLLSCMGYAIGIGNVWRFPYLCYRSGGGAFLVPYLIMLFSCGIPLFFVETSLGQFASTGFLTIFKIAPIFKGAGYAIIVVNIFVIIYFNTVVSYPLLFLINCFRTELPWIDCNNEWNTEYCVQLGKNSLLNANESVPKKTPADEFFHKHILQISDGIDNVGSIVWPLFICNAITWLVTYLCIMKGVKTVGKVVYFTATFPFFVLFVLFVRGVTLPGAWKGISFYIYPQWHQLTNLKVWADAAIQIFYSLGPGWGGILNMASYNSFHNNINLDSIIVPVMNCGTSIFAGFVVFSVIGFMSHETGLPVETVATGGPGLAFITYPEAISLLPWPHLWAVLFFLMLFFLGIDSEFVQTEAVIAGIIDEYPALRKHSSLVTLITCLLLMLLSTIFVTNGGMYWLQLFDWYSASITIILICLIEVVIVGWTYGVNNFVKDIEFMTQKNVHWYWRISCKFSAPLILTFIFITTITFNTPVSYNGVTFPDWAITVGWGTCLSSMLCIPLYIGYRILYFEEGDIFQRIRKGWTATEEWGPADPDIRTQWLASAKLETKLKKLDKLKDSKMDEMHQKFVQLSTDPVV